MKELILLRHAKTSYNLNGILTGQLDIPILDSDKDKILELVKIISDYDFDVILCSDLLRTKQTLELILPYLKNKPNIIYSKELREINYGELQGQNKDELKLKYPLFKKSSNYIHPGGESISSGVNRAFLFIESILNNYDKILVITHSGIIRGLYAKFNNLEFDKILNLKIEHENILKCWQNKGKMGAKFFID